MKTMGLTGGGPSKQRGPGWRTAAAGRPGRLGLVGLLAFTAFLLAGCGPVHPEPTYSGDEPWWLQDEEVVAGLLPSHDGIHRESLYLTMRDGVRLAVDVYLPRGLHPEERVPTLIEQTRYHRAMDYRWPLGRNVPDAPGYAGFFASRGYAYIIVDARGSGASFGRRDMEWSPEEVRDGYEVVEWIVSQPWSDGTVGALGVSYPGTSAEMLLTTRHPAVRAAIPQFALFDAYTDVAAPGGIRLSWFTEAWGALNAALDEDRLGSFLGGKARFVIRGVRPVDGDRWRRLVREAIRERDNYDVHAEVSRLDYRDDSTSLGWTFDVLSPHAHAAASSASGAAVYSYSGWLDAGYALGAIHRFLNVRTPGSRLLLGPWDHGGEFNVSPYGGERSAFRHGSEQLRFLDLHLRGIDHGISEEPPVRYYTMGAERWNSADTWPPAGRRNRAFYFNVGDQLREDPTDVPSYRVFVADTDFGTGQFRRWRGLVGSVPPTYEGWAERIAGLPSYTTDPFSEDVEVTGHPTITLFVTSSAPDATFFVYLSEVTGSGEVRYVTEGQLRAIHRQVCDTPLYETPGTCRTFRRSDAWPLTLVEVAELTFDLLPTSYLFPAGSRIRISIAGADRDHFEALPGPAPTVRIHHGGEHASRLNLPVMTGEPGD
jgi:uncharacterized protein